MTEPKYKRLRPSVFEHGGGRTRIKVNQLSALEDLAVLAVEALLYVDVHSSGKAKNLGARIRERLEFLEKERQ